MRLTVIANRNECGRLCKQMATAEIPLSKNWRLRKAHEARKGHFLVVVKKKKLSLVVQCQLISIDGNGQLPSNESSPTTSKRKTVS